MSTVVESRGLGEGSPNWREWSGEFFLFEEVFLS